MFALCPHCQFLVTVDPRSGRLPSNCPGCGEVLEDVGEVAAADQVPAQDAASSGDAAAGANAATGDVGADASAASDAWTPASAGVTGGGDVAAVGSAGPGSGARAAVKQTDDARVASESPGHSEASEASGPTDATGATDAPDPSEATDVPIAPEALEATDARDSTDATVAAETIADDDAGPETGGEAPDSTPAGPTPLAALAVPKGGKPRPTRALPRFLDQRVAAPRAGRRAQLLTWGAVALLTLVLGLQLVLADRARLSQDAQWRPLVASLCGVFGCTIPPWHEPDAFVMLSRDVRAHPRRPGTLRVSASFRNDARWAQAWPSLLLTLSDLDGRTAGARVFAPSDYVGADAPGLLAPGQSANVTLDVVEPAPRIVAFTFDFR